MVLMVQKEVAERIVGVKESLLSISVKAYIPAGNNKICVSNYFSPAPKVDSAVLKISKISKDFFQDIDEKKFFETVKRDFPKKKNAHQ